jgi:hypothetical protein
MSSAVIEATHASEEADFDSPLAAIDLVRLYVSKASRRRLRRHMRTKKTSSKSQCFGIETRSRPYILADVDPPVGCDEMQKDVCLQKFIYWAYMRKKFMKVRKIAPRDGEGTGHERFIKPQAVQSPHTNLFQAKLFGNKRISQTCRSTRGCAATTKGKTFYCLNPIHLHVEGFAGFGTTGRTKPPTIDQIVRRSNDDVSGSLASAGGPESSYENDPEQTSTSSLLDATINEEEDPEEWNVLITITRIRR